MLFMLAAACRPAAAPAEPAPSAEATAEQAEATSLLGAPLVAPELPADVLADREAKLAAALADFEKDPGNVEAIIWYGRRTAYLGRYQASIEIYTKGLEQHPDSAELHRHRGHRFITTRQFDKAVTDLQRAAELIEGKPDVVEEDGLPNDAGIPTGTRRTNVYYHLGLAHFLRGEFDAALAAYQACLEASTTDDMRVATSHWLWMTLRRLDRTEAATAVLEPITPKMTLYENFDYHRLLLMYRGRGRPRRRSSRRTPTRSAAPPSALGWGTWHLVNGRADEARQAFEAAGEERQLGRVSVSSRRRPSWPAGPTSRYARNRGMKSALASPRGRRDVTLIS